MKNLDQNALQIRLDRVRDILQQVDKRVASMETIDAKLFPDKLETICTEAALLSEKAACIMRQILYDTGTVSKTEYLGKAADAQGIRISYGDGILEVALPCPLPKKKGKYSGQFLIDPLYAALEQFTKSIPLPRFRECCICVVHVYDPQQENRKYFDYDNLQQKQILDVIAAYTMVDDNSLLCDVHHTSQPGEASSTRVFVMPQKRFPEWLAGRENGQ